MRHTCETGGECHTYETGKRKGLSGIAFLGPDYFLEIIFVGDAAFI